MRSQEHKISADPDWLETTSTWAAARLCFFVALVLACGFTAPSSAAIPVIYSTDLFHPPDDPDDHYDLATLYALPELDVRGILIDRTNIREQRPGQRRAKAPGIVALQQIFHLSGKQAPYALGLQKPLRSATDPATDRPDPDQQGVRLILSVLRESQAKVNIFTVGSLADVAAAYNRAPDLLRAKVQTIYVNAGYGPDGQQKEWNVRLDPHAYQRVMLSDLPIAWYPCFGHGPYQTFFQVDQAALLDPAPSPLRAFLVYALDQSDAEPIPFLAGDHPTPKGPRNMWCTASFIDLAGRKIYRTENGFQALGHPPRSDPVPVDCYRMQPVRLTGPTDGTPHFHADLDPPSANVRVFRQVSDEYTPIMTSVLKHLLSNFGRTRL